jgi:hypothetical protein
MLFNIQVTDYLSLAARICRFSHAQSVRNWINVSKKSIEYKLATDTSFMKQTECDEDSKATGL